MLKIKFVRQKRITFKFGRGKVATLLLSPTYFHPIRYVRAKKRKVRRPLGLLSIFRLSILGLYPKSWETWNDEIIT